MFWFVDVDDSKFFDKKFYLFLKEVCQELLKSYSVLYVFFCITSPFLEKAYFFKKVDQLLSHICLVY